MRGTGGWGGNPGVMGAGSLREAGEEGAGGGISKGGGSREKCKKCCSIGTNISAKYFAIGKAHGGGNPLRKGAGTRIAGCGRREVQTPLSLPH